MSGCAPALPASWRGAIPSCPRAERPVAAWRDRYGPWAVVTGASAGIGKSFARQLAERGLDLILVARREPLLEALAKELSARHGVAVRPLVADLSDARGLDRLVADTASVEVGLLVNNAGAPAFHGHFVQRQRAEVEALVDFNTRVQAVLAHHFLQPMARRRRGGLIQVAERDRKSTRLNSSHVAISYAVFCLKKKTVSVH